MAGSIINLVSSYGRETYQRREFTLKDRVLTEKKYADDFLYKMLPITVAETLKVWYCYIGCVLRVWTRVMTEKYDIVI